jgi:spore coat polysaccharide biosynthesis predicted glycosyltransferase SpsG/RimJ/RimL family protein N-acetyltransferase
MAAVAFRCDADGVVGAGHVARCVQIALALEAGGGRAKFAGRYEGIGALLLEEAGLEAVPTADGPAGIPEDVDAAVVDSYEIPASEVEAASRLRPVAVIEDGPSPPRAGAVLSYHLDAAERTAVPAGVVAIRGPDYAPVRPAAVAARRQRALAHALVSAGASSIGESILDRAVEALRGLDGVEDILVAAQPGESMPGARRQLVAPGEMPALLRWADVAVSAAGSTPYELACAGVPSVLAAVADNQLPIMQAFNAAGLAVGVDARTGAERLPAAVAHLADAGLRTRLAAAGPAVIDGYGAYRARDALLAAFGGAPAPTPLRYRPATPADAERLLEWRNDPDVQAVSRSRAPVAPAAHERWLAATLADPDRTLLVAEAAGQPAATVRFDRRDGAVEISVTVAPGWRGRGIGARTIREASELHLAAHPDVARIVTEVMEPNVRALRAFERAGYARVPERTAADGVLLALNRAGLRVASRRPRTTST